MEGCLIIANLLQGHWTLDEDWACTLPFWAEYAIGGMGDRLLKPCMVFLALDCTLLHPNTLSSLKHLDLYSTD